MRLIKSFLPALIIALFISLLLVGLFFRRIEGTEIKKDTFLLNTTPTVVYDKNDKPLARFYNDRREVTKYKETPKEIIDSIISTEDRVFFEHAGINVKAISRAALAILQADGSLVQGGSTLTQQLIKNTHLNPKKSFDRKFKEMVYATALEKEFSKEEILEMYMNHLEFLWRAHGVKDAVMTYFGNTFEQFNKLPREERIAKGALIAALLKSPSQYDPFRHPEAALTRRNLVLKNLRTTQKITEEEYQKVLQKPLMILSKPKMVFDEEKIKYQELVDYAIFETAKKLDVSTNEILKGGYAIHTSFNTDVYNIIRKEYEKDDNFPENAVDGTKVQSSTVLVNPKNGELIAFTGGRDKPKPEDFLGFNRAYRLKKQPGSTIKPVVAYGPALESGKFSPYSSLLDEKGHSFPGGYVVKDWDNGGRGYVTMKEAIRQSWNIPAVWTLQQVGLNYAKEYTQKLGLDLSQEKTLGIALGGLEGGVSPLEMADSYQAFANKGIRTPAHAVKKIEDANKNILYKAVTEKNPVIKPQNASDIKDMLRNAVANGSARKAQIPGREIAGKTGTVQHPLIKGKVNADVWFVGFDEQIVGSVWMGFDSISSQRYLNVSSSFAAEFWSRLGERILNYYSEHGGLDNPESIETTKQPDNQPPTVKLNGESSITLTEGDVYNEQGATASDETDGDITGNIQTSGTVDTSKAGTYTITYNVSDKALNTASVTRTVTVKPKEVTVTTMNLQTESYDNNSSFYLSWDNVGENIKYQVYRNGELLQELFTNSYLDSSVNQGEDYQYQVVAYYPDTGQKIGESAVQTARLTVETPSDPNTEQPVSPETTPEQTQTSIEQPVTQ